MQNSRPRFVAYAAYARFGGRDEFIGWGAKKLTATAETLAWLYRAIDNRHGNYDLCDVSISVVDNFPELDARNWGPKLPYGCSDAAWLEHLDAPLSDDLPF